MQTLERAPRSAPRSAPAQPGIEVLRARAEAIGRYLTEMAARAESDALELPALAGRRVVTTGAGASEGPARVLAHVLRRDLRAEFVPLSRFTAPARDLGDTLVLFSQNLSPNARLALRQSHLFRDVIVFTSLPPPAADAHADAHIRALLGAENVKVSVLPPREESETLLRIVGPSVATYAALSLGATWARALSRQGADGFGSSPAPAPPSTTALEHAVRDAAAWARALCDELPASALLGDIAFVTVGAASELAQGLRWKWLEGLRTQDPPVWDLLQIAHGPLQSFHDRPLTLLALIDSGPQAAALLARLRAVLVPSRHRLIALCARLPAPWAFFEWDAALNALLLFAMERAGCDPYRWPAQGRDGPLYGLGGEPRS